MAYIIPVILVAVFSGIMTNLLKKNNNSEEEAIQRQNDDIADSMQETTNETQDQSQQDSMDTMNNEEGKPDAFGLMFKALKDLGCQPTKDGDGSLNVSYQGEEFHMQIGGMYARVWDPFWAGVKADDPNLPIIREAVNSANFNFGPTVVLSNPNKEGVIAFHTRRDILLHPALPNIELWVRSVLDSFFDAKESVRRSYRQITEQQAELLKGRRPVGFTTTNPE